MKLVRKLRRAFTLLEVLIVILIIVLLAALIMPQLAGATDDAKVAKLLSVVNAVRTAVQTQYNNTSVMAEEDSSQTETSFHQLSLQQSTPGWRGPYLDHPLTSADNPFGGAIRLYASFNKGNVNGGFDLLGSGGNSATGNGQFMEFEKIPEAVAAAVDKALDEGIGGNWKSTGRVKWANNILMIFLMDIPN